MAKSSDQPFRFDHNKFTALLARYTDFERRTIDAYFAVIALTRKTRKLSEGIIRGELEYWSKYDNDAVMYAIRKHIEKYAGKSEGYTRGILRHHVSHGRVKEMGTGGIVRESFEAVEGSGGGYGSYGQGDEASRYVSIENLPI